MNAWLVSLDGDGEVAIDRALMIVGRHGQCDIRLDSHRVSRRHCCLAPDRGGILVRDLNSTNGTRINGRPVGSGLLRPGDELGVAHFRFRLELRPDTGIDARLDIGDQPPDSDEQHPETLRDHPQVPPTPPR